MTVALDGFSVTSMTFDGTARDVYRRGKGPGVVVMHEIPGITPPVQHFARVVADAGFTVFLPQLFGTPDKPMTMPYAIGQVLRACVSREFRVLAANESSPIVSWLRALCAAAHQELGGKGVGAIGMCLTGNFALALMVEPSMMAPVLSQPSLPGGKWPSAKRGLHISPEDLVIAKRRAKEGVSILGLRFTEDPACPKERFDRLREEFGSAFEAIEIDSSPGNPHGIPKNAHSVVTQHLVDREGHPTRVALDRVLAFYREHLA
jgi:dienelactone hydrolase